MAIETIKNGGFVAEEIAKINSNFQQCALSEDVPTKTSDLTNDSGFIKSDAVPTKTSELTNDSGFITNAAVPTKTSDLTNDSGFITSNAVPTKTSQLTNDSGFATTAQVTAASATKVTFATSNWANGTFTTPTNGKNPSVVMRKNGSNYGVALVDVQVSGSNVVITSDEAFDGYIILV